jgi:hypothetical protein
MGAGEHRAGDRNQVRQNSSHLHTFYEAGPVKRRIGDGWDQPSIRVLYVSPQASDVLPFN